MKKKWSALKKGAVAVTLVTAAATDARPNDGKATRYDPAQRRRRERHQKGAVILFAIVFLTGSAAALFAKGGHLERRRMERRVQLAAKVLDGQLRDVHKLQRQVSEINRDPVARERLAREELGYSRRGEIVFLLAEPDENSSAQTP